MSNKIHDILFSLIFWALLQGHFQFEISAAASISIFLLMIVELALRLNRYGLKFKQITRLSLLLGIIYGTNLIFALHLPEIAIFNVVSLLSTIIFYALMEENHKKISNPRNTFFNNIAKFYILFTAIWAINLLQIKQVFDFKLIAGIFALTIISLSLYYYYFLGILNRQLLIDIALVGVFLGAFKYALGGIVIDPFGISTAIFVTVLLDLLQTRYAHNHIKALSREEWHQKLVFIFLLLILTIQIANSANFPQKLGAFFSRVTP